MTAGLASNGSRPAQPRDLTKLIANLAVVAAAVWAIVGLDVRWSRLVDVPERLWDTVWLMGSRLTWSDLGDCISDLWQSISMAWLGTLIGALFAIPLGFVAAENLVPKWFALAVRQVLNLLRAIPEIILVLILLPVFGLTGSAGILAIGIGSIGTLGKLFADVIEGIDNGPMEAADAVGANGLQRLRWGAIPQAAPEIASFILYRFEINIRVSAILGAVGAGGIGQTVSNALRIALPPDWGLAGMALIVMIVGTIAVDTISGRVRRRILAGPPGNRRGDPIKIDSEMIVMDRGGSSIAG